MCFQGVHYMDWCKYERDEETGETLQHGLFDRYINGLLKMKIVSYLKPFFTL